MSKEPLKSIKLIYVIEKANIVQIIKQKLGGIRKYGGGKIFFFFFLKRLFATEADENRFRNFRALTLVQNLSIFALACI